MILKNLTRKKTGTRQLVRYIFRYLLQEEKTGGAMNLPISRPFIIKHNIRSSTVEGFIKEFEQNLRQRKHKRSDQTIIHHTILSWSQQDTRHITDTMLRRIARKFIQLRGENNLYVGTKHIDRSHIHLHIAVSGNQLNGKSSRLSQKQFAALKKRMDTFQKEQYPQLIHSLPRHGHSLEKYQMERVPKIPIQQKQELSKKDADAMAELAVIRKQITQKEKEPGREREILVGSPINNSLVGEYAAGGISDTGGISPG
jgi:hypothetical protein